MAEIETVHFRPGIVPVHAGQGQQVADEEIRPADLGTDISQVFVFTDFLFQDFGIGCNHRKRRFQLMAGIIHKLLLPGEGLLHRPDHAPDQQPGQEGKQQAGRRSDQDRGAKHVRGGKKIQPGVQNNQKRCAIIGNLPEKLISDPAAVLSERQDVRCHRGHLLIRIQIRPVGSPGRDGSVLIQRDGIGIAQPRGGRFPAAADRRQFLPDTVFFRLRRLRALPVVLLPAGSVFLISEGNTGPAVLRQDREGIFRLDGDIMLIGQMDCQHNTGGNQDQHSNYHQGHAPAKSLNHDSSSRE